MNRAARLRRFAGLLAALLLGAGLAVPATAQQNSASGPDYMLLQSRFGELCTMCEAIVLCERDGENGSGSSPVGYTMYHFHTKTFWGQVRTIYEYMIRWIQPVVSGGRPVTIAELPVGSARPAEASSSRVMGYLVLEPAVVEIDGRQIDRWSGAWQDRDGRVIGSCRRLPLRETLQALEDPALDLRETSL